MARRTQILATGEIYHVFNRAIDKRPIFSSAIASNRIIELIRFYQRIRPLRYSKLTAQQRRQLIDKKDGELLVEIICYCVMPNHFHLLIKQVRDGGITSFLRKVTDGYSRYFNLTHHRLGALFQGNFKAVRIVTNEQLLHVSRYIHLNPVTAYIVEKENLREYKWSSYLEYINQITPFCSKEVILGQFHHSSYEQFVLDNADHQRQLKKIRHLIIEDEP